ncbi:hypothetical protein MNB_SM-3-1463 [hydrothermal vent metagenome]|uniref:Ferrous iron transporter FeoA-like domain-containing protein n=1 Tax=hydrothermal vent metagenome TaxID=652676 RepID=A0A1W1D2G8_9ZZZZ
MNIFECSQGCKAKVVKIDAQGELKQRLLSFGIIKGAEIEVLTYAPAKATIEIQVAKMKIALRSEEAKLIQIQKVA